MDKESKISEKSVKQNQFELTPDNNNAYTDAELESLKAATDGKDVKAIWNECLEIIRDNVNPLSFKTWFEPIVPLKIEGKQLTIQVPSQFFYEWLEEHYYSLIKKNAYQSSRGRS